MTSFRTAADATRASQLERSNALARSLTAKRTDRLIAPLREALSRLRETDPDTPPLHQYGYGMVEITPDRAYREIDSQGRLHLIDVISGDQIDGVTVYVIDHNGTTAVYPGAYFPGGEESFPGNITGDGAITAGLFSGVFNPDGPSNPPNGSQIRLFDGTQQSADPDLVAQTKVDNKFIGRGLSYIWTRMIFQEGRFNGDPTVRVFTRSRKVVDPRDATAASDFEDLPQSFSINPYRFIFDYIVRPKSLGGAGVSSSFLDLSTFQPLASWGEMLVTTQQFSKIALFTTRSNQNTGTPPINTNHILEFEEEICPFQFGDVVNINLSSGQQAPSNLSTGTDYFVVPIRPIISSFQITGIALADSLENALQGVTIPQGTRTTDITVTKVKEVRFQTGFTYRAGEAILTRMLESCGAGLYLKNGKIAITSQQFPDEADIKAVELDELIGTMSIATSLEADDRATALSGSYKSIINLFIPEPYPTVNGGGVFEEEDGKEILRPYELPFVAKSSVAQRLATIELRRRRQELSLAFSGDLSLYRLRPNTVFSVDFSKYGLNEQTTFEVRSQTLFFRATDGSPSFNVDIEARQLEAGTFDLDLSSEEFVQAAKIPGLTSPFQVQAPSNVRVTEELFQTRKGAGVRARANISWNASPSLFVREYEVSFRRSGTDNFFFLARVPSTDLQTEINDLEPALYDFRVIAINSVGSRSDPDAALIENFEIVGLSALPSDPTNVRGQVIGSATVFLSWDRSADLDVREGGFVEIRHSPQITAAVAKDSTFLDSDVGGQTSIAVPFLQGTYWVRFEDSTGQFSSAVSWSTQSRRPVGIAFLDAGTGNPLDETNTDPDAFTIQEDSTFPSTDPGNTLIFDTDHLELPLEDTFDDETDVDAITNIDEVGGGAVTPEGFYFFSTAIEVDTATRILVETVLNTEIFDVSTSIDAEDNFDQIPDVDQIGGSLLNPGLATAEIQVRFSNGTIASDTFGPWEPINTQFIEARSFEFRVVARSSVETVNIRINEARVRMRVVNL